LGVPDGDGRGWSAADPPEADDDETGVPEAVADDAADDAAADEAAEEAGADDAAADEAAAEEAAADEGAADEAAAEEAGAVEAGAVVAVSPPQAARIAATKAPALTPSSLRRVRPASIGPTCSSGLGVRSSLISAEPPVIVATIPIRRATPHRRPMLRPPPRAASPP
jgi:hypothetical protein